MVEMVRLRIADEVEKRKEDKDYSLEKPNFGAILWPFSVMRGVFGE